MSALADAVRIHNRYWDCAYMDCLRQSNESSLQSNECTPSIMGPFLHDCMSMTMNSGIETYHRCPDYKQSLLEQYWGCAEKRVAFFKEKGITTVEEFRPVSCSGNDVFRECMSEPVPLTTCWQNTMQGVMQVMTPIVTVWTLNTALAAHAWSKGEKYKAAAHIGLNVVITAVVIKAILG